MVTAHFINRQPGIYFQEETVELIHKLFKLIDKNCDGTLSKEDFVIFEVDA